MAASAVARALYAAHKEKATGWIKLAANGREAELLLSDGDVVGARMAFGFQAPVQALLEAGRIDLPGLDALWARGEADKLEGEVLAEIGVPANDAHVLQVLANVRSLSAQAEHVEFEATAIEPMFEPVPGARAVRAAFEVGEDRLDDRLFRCADASACGEWLGSDDERALLSGLSAFGRVEIESPVQIGLLRVLEYDGKLESLSESEWAAQAAAAQARQAEQERLAEETERRAEEARLAEVARQAEAARLAVEEIRKTEAERVAAEEARKAEAARLVAEEARRVEVARLAEETRKAEVARLAEETRKSEAARLAAEELRKAEAARLSAEARKAEAERVAAEEARRVEAARLAAEEARKAEAARLAAEEARKAEAARFAAEEARKAEAARFAAEEARRAETARLAAEEARKAEAARLAAEEARRAEAVRAAAEEARKAEADRLAAEEARKAEAARAAAEEARKAEAARVAAEEARKAEAARAAAEEARRADAVRLAAEDARRAEEARIAEEARLLESARQAEEARVAEERAAAARLLPEVSDEDVAIILGSSEDERPASAEDTPSSWGDLAAPGAADVPWGPTAESAAGESAPDEAEAMRQARSRAHEELMLEMSEALRRSASVAEDAWLQPDAPIELTPADVAPESISAPPIALAEQIVTPSVAPAEPTFVVDGPDEPESFWTIGPPTHRPQSIISGTETGLTAPVTEEADLWRIVSPELSTEDALSASFEEALRRVDQHLERLVGMGPSEPAVPSAEAPPIELEIEATRVQPPPDSVPVAETAPGAGYSVDLGPEDELDDLWPFEDDEAPLEGDPTDPVEAARARRQRLLRRAMENLGALRPPPGSAAAQPAAAAPTAAYVAPVPTPTEPTRDDQQLARLIEQRFVQLKGRDHFTVLGLPRTAGREQVKVAFLALAKSFHPDRLPPSLAAMAPKMTAVFEAIREAYDALLDDAKRTTYAHSLDTAAAPTSSAGAGSREKAEAHALEMFKKGELAFKKREYAQADDLYSRAYAADKKGMYLAAQGWAIYMDPLRKAELPRVKQLMMDALRADSNCDRAQYQLGVIARVENDLDRAERYFRDAVRSNPKHLEANQELRLIEMRRKKTR